MAQDPYEGIRKEIAVTTHPLPPTPILFPLAWYDYAFKVSTFSPSFPNDGSNLILLYDRFNNPTHESDLQVYLKAARSAGFRVMVEVMPLTHNDPNNFDPAQLRSFIQALRAQFDDVIWAWYLVDEPEGGLSAGKAVEAFNIIKCLDPGRLIAIAFRPDDTSSVADYRQAMDVYMFDYYPATTNSIEFEGFGNYFEILKSHASLAGDKTYWPILQGSSRKNVDGNEVYRIPTPAEIRYMAYSALQAGAEGLFFYRRGNGQPTFYNPANLAPLLVVLRNQVSSFVRGSRLGQVGTSIPSPSVVATLHSAPTGNGYLLLLIHHGGGGVGVTVVLDAFQQVTSVTGEGGRSLGLDGMKFTDSLTSFDVKLYEIQGRLLMPRGDWNINANKHKGVLRINSVDAQGNLDATLFDKRVIGFWDDGANKITFMRLSLDDAHTDPSTYQIYTGFLIEDSLPVLTGYFESFSGSGGTARRSQYGWFASLIS
jgi:hypothetical protein